MTTIATLFSGGEGVGVGARDAGLRHLWGIEHDADIAAVARKNGFDAFVGDVCKIDPATLECPDVLHASPPCPSFSAAKVGAQETAQDIALGQATARFIKAQRPRWFTLENVWLYRKSESWRIIAQALGECGYFFDVAHINSADFAVPQTRKRMWVRAVRGGFVPHLPEPEPWVGWYEAIEDLLPDLPDDEFAPWQLERMPDELREIVTARSHPGIWQRIKSFLMSAGNATAPTMCGPDEPARTVVANHPALGVRAFLATGQWDKPYGAADRGPQIRDGGEPVPTVTASNKCDTRAFVMDSQNASRKPTTREADEPTFTVTNAGKGLPRAAVHGRVVRLTTRCLARFQSFPDGYILPEQKTLAARVIGNAVPPLLYEKLVRSLTQ